ncbi:sulfatase family protein [Algibacter luteus]|uniref:sulfatase family protein n=1 Tax=Algibacter luteus TaxID=1178825 RepID=UPI002595117B|nr:sulfatase-like hydrolase/transferase [Algibacter luteus]WJJ95720.1 sulfatase-like hydrolase/transferase [Algibacter luteus]
MRKLFFGFLLLCACNIHAQSNSQKPNVVFIISDQHKLEETGAYGSQRSITPNIDELAKTGVMFNNAYTPAPVCAPARASLVTGMYPYANGAIYHKAPVTMPNGKVKNLGSGYLRETGYHEGIVTLADVFKEQGYVSASPGKMHVHGELQKDVDEDHKEGNDMGFDEIGLRYYTYFPGGHYEDEVGEDTYMRYRQFKKYGKTYKGGSMHLNEEYVPTLVKNDEDNFDMVVARKSVEFINKRAEDGKNFFLHVGFEKPHAPFTTTQTYLDMHTPSEYQLPETYDDWYKKGKYPWVPNWVHSGIPKNLEKAQNVMAAYNACITEMDDMVGRVVNALKEKGLYDNTIIIYTTDHGEHLFEHGLRGKHNMYEDAVNVPFIVSYPKLFKGNTINNSIVSFIDLMPTLAELINGKTPETAQGVSLLDVLTKGEELKDRVVYSEFRGGDYKLLPGARNVPSRMMRKGDYKFVYTHGIIDQLYNIKTDPDELNNLIFDDNYKTIYQDMYFQTLAGWQFQEYAPIAVFLKKKKIKWQKSDAFNTYAVYYSLSDNIEEARLVLDNIAENSFEPKEKGYYWLVARPKLSKTSKFYGDDIPVAVENYSYTLPISDILKFD